MKYIVVCGGVLSGVGKGVIASSTGVLCKSLGFRVTSIKIDPYLNIDAGTLTPYDHGEVFVLDDGGEVDLDLGNYERFLNVTLTKDHNITTGKIYKQVIENERKGAYLGKTVQVVPHITDCIQEWIERVSVIPVNDDKEIPDICIIELGGTVGDIESAPFVEALQEFRSKVGFNNFLLIHVSYVPVVGEQKSKPTQTSIKVLRSLGLLPDVIACRSNTILDECVRKKISIFCQVEIENVLSVYDCQSTLEVPLLLKEQGLLTCIVNKFGIKKDLNFSFLDDWKKMIDSAKETPIKDTRITVVGKYTHLKDSYFSLVKALDHACISLNYNLVITWIEASHLEENHDNRKEYELAHYHLKNSKNILIPGGFGERGIEGMILACKYARENKLNYFGICLGFQVMLIEFCRNVLGLDDANSTEFHKNTKNPVVIYMPEISKSHMGGTMRVGTRSTFIKDKNTRAFKIYGSECIEERHRHRYEFNIEYKEKLENTGKFIFSGQDKSGKRMEIVESIDEEFVDRFFMGVQYHPEYISKINKPSPIFTSFLKYSL